MYTREMQELLASTVDDYNPEKVLNLDEDASTNFAVFAEGVFMIEPVEGINTVISTDGDNLVYVIENVNSSITELEKDSIFVYPYGEEILIVKVASMSVENGIATIQGAELDMDEVFSHVKIESVADPEHAEVEEDSGIEAVRYLGRIEPDHTMQINGDDGSDSASKSFSFSVFYESDQNSNGDSVRVKGELALNLGAAFSFHKAGWRSHVRLQIDTTIDFGISITGRFTNNFWNKDIPLKDITLPFRLGCIKMKIEPEITLRVDASVELNGRFKATTVATISLGGYDFRFSKIDVEWKNVEFDGEIFLFFNLKPTISVEETVLGAELNIVKLLIYMPVGVRLKFLDATIDLPDADLPDKKHTCNVCFKIHVDFVQKYSFRIMFLNSPKLGLDIPLCGEKSNPLFRMYWSLDYGEFEKGDCPHYVYKLTASVTDNEGESISGASVSVEEKQASTNDQGIAVLYLPAEKYKVTAVSGDLSASKSVKIEDACKVTFCLSEEEEDEPSSDWWTDIDFEGIWDSGNNGDLTDESADEEMTYNDHKYALFDISMTWTEARAYCESLGGHLVTITSPEEQAFIEVLIDGGLKSQYWLGMYRSQGNLVWVTGEKISYTNWDSNQPDRVHAFGGYEDYVEILRVPHNCCGASSYRYRWNDIYNDNDNHCKSYTPNSVGFICEFEPTPKQAPTLDAIYGGEYSTEVNDTYTLKTASYADLVPGAQYVLLAMVSTDVENPLSADNLLYIDQAVAEEDGSLVFHYVQRTPVDISYVVACGASSKNLSDAEITFPEMEADGEIQAVNPTVVYDGKTLTEGQDYTIAGTVSFTEPGTYTCYIRGVRNYTGLVECVYSVNGGVEEIASGWSGDTTWVLTNDGVLTFSGTGNMKNYGYNGGQPWLNKGVDITSVVIEDGVASVGSGAFKDLTSLKSVTLPETLTKMGEAAFYGSGLESVEIPASLWTIQPYTFKNCINLKSVKFNERNLQKISDGAFYGTGLTELVLPDCLDILDVYAFKGCKNLTSITIGSGLTELREAVFYGTAITEITIPEGITKIGPYAFKRCAKLETIDLPESLTSVGEAAFYEATALKTVELPDGVTTIGNYAFRKCAAIETLKLSAELVTVGECAFYGCTGLTELVIPDKVTTIKPYAFKTCTGLTSVTLGSKVATIGEGAFNTCTGLKTIVFPASLKTIGDYCFSGSVNLWKLTFEGDAPTIGAGTFKGLAATAFYPGSNTSWTSDLMQNYGGKITWKAN